MNSTKRKKLPFGGGGPSAWIRENGMASSHGMKKEFNIPTVLSQISLLRKGSRNEGQRCQGDDEGMVKAQF